VQRHTEECRKRQDVYDTPGTLADPAPQPEAAKNNHAAIGGQHTQRAARLGARSPGSLAPGSASAPRQRAETHVARRARVHRR